MVGGWLVAVLNGNLHVVEADVGEDAERLRRQPHRRSNQVAIEAGLAGGFDDLRQIAPSRRFTTRKMHLQYAER
jgi:hypothetical protein